MIKKLLLLEVFILLFIFSNAQGFSDNFTDGDFTTNPTWIGETSKFIVNTSGQLQLDDQGPSSPAYLVTASNAISNSTWEFYVHFDFAPSTSNYGRVYLVSDNPNLTGPLNGYYVKVGGISGSADDVSLYRQNGTNTTLLIDGTDGTVGTDPVDIKIRVTRDSIGKWELFTDLTATGNSFNSEGFINDNSISQSQYFGVLCNYTSTRSDKFFFDDFIVSGQAFQDTTPPIINQLTVNSNIELELSFNEKLDSTSAKNTANYLVNKGIGNPSSAILNNDSTKVILSFSAPFLNGEEYDLEVKNIADQNSNIMQIDTLDFLYFVPVPASNRDVVINEFMADPSPPNSLPNAEFVELYNASNKVFDLNGWTLGEGSSASTLSTFILKPNEYLIICKQNDENLFSAFGKTQGQLTFSTLVNGGDKITLSDPNGNVIDNLEYDLDWYKDATKEDGGWSIEQINPLTDCIGVNNYAASNDNAGGTPGAQNSIFDTLPDLTPPELVNARVISADSILLNFNEFLDSTTTNLTSNYSFNTSAVVAQARNQSPEYTSVLLILSTPLQDGIIHTITVSNVLDCSGNLIGTKNSTEMVIPAKANFREVVVNEFMADLSPNPNQLPAKEYIEVFNASNKVFDLNNWTISDASSTTTLGNYILKAGDFLIIANASDVSSFSSLGNVLGVSSLPSLNDADDQIILKDEDATVIDELSYNRTWYKDINKQDGGWAIEQINPFSDCSGANNFSASNNNAGGTPGVQNSVFDTLPDTTSPALMNAIVVGTDSILLTFNELLDSTSTTSASNYSFNTNAVAAQARNQGPEYTSVLIILGTPLEEGVINTITVSNVLDCSGNSIGTQNTADLVIPAQANFREIVINEIYADPNPSIGLPEAEFIELYNASNKIFELVGWTIGDPSSVASLDPLVFSPGEYLIICEEGSRIAFETYGKTQEKSSFPSLGNSDNLFLRDQNGVLIDQVYYKENWFRNVNKENGGYTLEQINPLKPCTGGTNFIGSSASIGGTPGTQNSAYDLSPDQNGPSVKDVFVISEDSLFIEFDESVTNGSLDSAEFVFSNSNMVLKTNLYGPEDLSIGLKLLNPLDSGQLFNLSIKYLADCVGNLIDETFQIELALPEIAERNDIVINEILFNPKSGGDDYVEMYNRSEKVISLENWKLANYNDSITNPKPVAEKAILLFPNQYIVFTTDANFVINNYPFAVAERIFEIPSMPSYSNEEGSVYILDQNDNIIDNVNYTDDMHFALLQDVDGVSLERLDPNRASNDAGNFHSAAENQGFGTPGYLNSQYFPETKFSGEITVDPELFSPDNDGFQDIVNINYEFDAPGFVANVSIYDEQGRVIKTLVKNELLGAKGTFTWNGITDEGTKARIGIYLIFFEAFNQSGDKEIFKKPCVVAGQLR